MKLKILFEDSFIGLKIAFILSLILLVVCVSSITNAAEYTVATDGSDSNGGTNDDPFRTISKCASLATAGDTCWVRAGVYRETVTPAHSGTTNSPISFKAFPGDKVLISGADVVTGFSPVGNGRYRANIGWDLGLGQNQVFANGKMLWEARYPNASADVMSAMSGRIANPVKSGESWRFNDAGLPAGLVGAKINILPGPEWVAETGEVMASRSGDLSFVARYGQLKDAFYNLREGNPYMVWGHSALLDDASEFYHNGDSLEVMVNPASSHIEAKRRNYAFILDNRSHIVIDGFHVFAATITTGNPNPSSADLLRYPNAATSHHISINDVHFRYVSHFTHILPGTATSGEGVFLAWSKGMTNTGVMLFGANHSLTKSSIAFSAGNGIALAGTNHLVEDTVVHDIDYSVTDGAALLAGFYNNESSGHIVRFNSFSRGARSILTHRGVKNLKVIFNDLYDAGLVASDLGITYTYQTDGSGTEIARNLIHGNTREGDFIGIYLDNGSNGIMVHHNTVWDVSKALQLNSPSTNNNILNNTLIGNKQSVSSWVPPNSSAANMSGTNLTNNILVGERNVYGLVNSLSFDGSHNYETLNVADLQFVDVVNQDFRLLSSSPAVDNGRIIEGITGNFDGALPDMGAIEGVSSTPGASISAPCVYGDSCAPDYTAEGSGNENNEPEPVNTLLSNAGLETPFVNLAECSQVNGVIAEAWLDNSCWNESANIVYAQDNENPHSGTSSQRITTQGSLAQFVQVVDLNESTSYVASVWLRSNTTMDLTLMLRQTDSPYEIYHQETVRLSPQWQRVSLAGTTPTAESYLMLLTESKGTFWVDDAVLTEGQTSVNSNSKETAESPQRNLLQNNTNNTSGGGSFPLQALFLILLTSYLKRIRKSLLLPFVLLFTTQAQAIEDEWFMPKPSTTWQIQLQGDVNTNYDDAEMYDIDLYDSSEALIDQLQARGKNVICYFSAGSYEEWRPDAGQFNESDLGNALDGWPGERWLDIRSNNVREIMKNRLDLAEQKGCGGVDPDNMDGYLNESGLPINAQDQLDYNRFIAKEAHDRGLSVGLKNDLDQIEDLVDHFDFAVNEQCFQFNECDLLTPFINQGKAVFQIEYASKYTTGANAEATRNELCGDAQRLKLSTLVMPLLLDDEFRLSCLEENEPSAAEQQDSSNSGNTPDTTSSNTPNTVSSSSGGGSLVIEWLGFLSLFLISRFNHIRRN